jgi:ribosomal protein S18 acetylase RimI-like enzyme
MMLRRATHSDLNNIDPAAKFGKAWQVLLGQPGADAYLEVYGRTLVLDGTPIAIMGFMPLWAGVGDCWVILSDEAYRHPRTICRHMVKAINICRDVLKIHRLQASCRVDDDRQEAFFERFGFELEGIARGYYEQDRDYKLYARVWRDGGPVVA